MKITDVKVFIRENNQLKAYANVIIDDALIIRNVKVIEGKTGLFVAMPSRKLKNGEYQDVVHPLNSEIRTYMEQLVIGEYEREIANYNPNNQDDESNNYQPAEAQGQEY